MPSVLVTEAWNCEVGGQEPWPEDVKLYQHYETEQILLPDNANCLAVQAFLKMCKLDFKVEYKPNADYMSPSGRVPFIKCGLYLVAELEPIVSFVGNKGISLTKHLSATEKSDMRAYMSLVNTVLGNAENYITWVDWPTYSQVTKQRFGSVHPFPLNHILVYKKRRSVIKKLSALGWYNKTIDQVYAEVDQCCQALSERLETSRYFFGDQPCELDAEVFGHVHNILSTPAFPAILKLAEIMCSYPPLMRHCKHIATDYLEFVDADENVVHLSCLTKLSLSPKQISEEKLDEFVFYCDEGKNEFDLEVHDVGSLTNPENTIYHSLFE
ncbi:hypothetical protein AAG570_010276 [Ranatra chinensis]|uniref:Metaxin-2 n=1 Tax=Ranatra chinensis TaxID=642074 RepID=A0ABD0YM21_9HEMI